MEPEEWKRRICVKSLKKNGGGGLYKRFVCILAALLLAAPALALPARGAEAAPPPALSAAYLVMDADTGQVLIEQNADEERSPASITKIMTMGLAMEKAQGVLDTQLTVSYDDVHQLEAGSSHIALLEGEQVRLEDVLYGTEIASANDGANVLAEYIGGSIPAGVDAMNQKAAELGLSGTHFTNPHGLYDENHYTTARDMAAITRWALAQPGFADVFCRTETWTMAPTNLQPEERYFSINDWMRLSGKYYRSYAKDSKQGFHNEAQYTFVCYAEQSDMRLICVILGAPQRYDKFTDACALLDYCFANFTRVEVGDDKGFTVPVAGGGETLGNLQVSGAAASFLLHKDTDPRAITAEYSIPERMLLGQEFAPSVTFRLPASSGQSAAEITAALDWTGLDQVLRASTYVPLRQRAASAGRGGTLVAAAVAALAVSLIIALILRRSKRKKAEEVRRRRAMLYPTPAPSRPRVAAPVIETNLVLRPRGPQGPPQYPRR